MNQNSQTGIANFQPGVPVVKDSFAQANDIIMETMGLKPRQMPNEQMSQAPNQSQQFSQYSQQYQQGSQEQQYVDPRDQQLLRAADIIYEQRAREVAESRTPRFMQRTDVNSQVGNVQGNQVSASNTTNQQQVPQQGVDDWTKMLFGNDANTAPSGSSQQAPVQQQQQKQAAPNQYDEVDQFSESLTNYNAGLAKVAIQNGIDPDVLFKAVSQFSPEKLANAVIAEMRSVGNVGQQQVNQQHQQQMPQQVDSSMSSPNMQYQQEQGTQQFNSIINAPKPNVAPIAGRSTMFGGYTDLQI